MDMLDESENFLRMNPTNRKENLKVYRIRQYRCRLNEYII